jgi:hypothetical protein
VDGPVHHSAKKATIQQKKVKILEVGSKLIEKTHHSAILNSDF